MKQMKHVRNEIVPLIRDVCQKLVGHAHDNEVRLLLGTAAVESSLIHRKQLGGGPARGIWQMEVATARDIFRGYLSRKCDPLKDDLWFRFAHIWLKLVSVPIWDITKIELVYHLEHFDDFACAMARVKYLRDPDPIPDTVEGQAHYWKRVYNTPAGKGTIEHYLSQWCACGCEALMEVT